MGCLACATLLLSVLFVCSFCLTSGLVRTSRILSVFDVCSLRLTSGLVRTSCILSVFDVCSLRLTSGLVRTSRILDAFDICHPSTLSIVRFVMAYLIVGCCSGAPSFSFLGAMYDRTTTLPAPIGIFIETDQRWKQLQAEQKFYILRTQPLRSNTFHNYNPTTRFSYCSRLQYPQPHFLQKTCPLTDFTCL